MFLFTFWKKLLNLYHYETSILRSIWCIFPIKCKNKACNIYCAIYDLNYQSPFFIFVCSNIFSLNCSNNLLLKKQGNINSSFKITSDFPWWVMCKLRVWRVRTSLLGSGDKEVTLTLISCFVTLGQTKTMFSVTKTASHLFLSLLKCVTHSTLFSPSHSRLIQLLSYSCNYTKKLLLAWFAYCL